MIATSVIRQSAKAQLKSSRLTVKAVSFIITIKFETKTKSARIYTSIEWFFRTLRLLAYYFGLSLVILI